MAGFKKKVGPAHAGLRFLGLIAAFAPAPACAGAWVAPKGGQEIMTSAVGERNELRFYETAAYIEAPIGDSASLVIAPWVEQNYDTIEGWRGEAVASLKWAALRGDHSVVAVQAGGYWRSDPSPDCSEGGAEVRFLGGRSLGSSSFLNIEGAFRTLEGGCSVVRADMTAGFRPTQNWLFMGQVFYDEPTQGDQSLKAQVTVVRFGESGRGVQLGLRSRIDGEAEAALVLGFWGRPGD